MFEYTGEDLKRGATFQTSPLAEGVHSPHLTRNVKTYIQYLNAGLRDYDVVSSQVHIQFLTLIKFISIPVHRFYMIGPVQEEPHSMVCVVQRIFANDD